MGDMQWCAAEVARLAAARDAGEYAPGYDPLKHGNVSMLCKNSIREIAPLGVGRRLVKYNTTYSDSPLGRAIEAAGGTRELKYLPTPVYNEVQRLLAKASHHVDAQVDDNVEWAIIGAAVTGVALNRADLLPSKYTIGLGNVGDFKVRAVVGVTPKGNSVLDGLTFRSVEIRASIKW